MSNVDPKTIGQQQKIQDPMDAIKQAEGTYKDNTESMSIQEKVDYLPKGPDPSPFTLRG